VRGIMAIQVLLVDDNATVLRTLKGIFQLRHFDVWTAASAEAAIAALTERSFDLVVTDMRMEKSTSGYDVIRAAKSQPNEPVAVVLSAYPIPAPEWKAAGANAMFLKGAGVLQMLDDLAEMVHRRDTSRSKPADTSPQKGDERAGGKRRA
jgi:CheY-like chemotaxis protein